MGDYYGTILVLYITSIIEQADLRVLPAVFNEIAYTYDASPSKLSLLTFCRGVTQAIFSLPSGYFGNRYHRGKM